MQALKKLIDIPEPDMGAPLPFVMSSEYKLSICYNQAQASYYDGKMVTEASIAGVPRRVATLRFKTPRVWKFGDPTENGQPFHPLAAIGLMDFYAFEVENSDWAYRSISGEYENKHFIILFHDSTFEILADSYSVHSLETEFVMEACENEFDSWT